MRVLFGRDFEGGAWPGPTADAPLLFGEARVGLPGLIRLCETFLGLSGQFPSRAERAAGLVEILEATPGFWTASFAQAPMAVAERLLDWHDELTLHGWHGQPASPRLTQLASVTRPLAESFPGLSDRLVSIVAAATQNRLPFTEIVSCEPDAELPSPVRRLFELGASRGTTLRQALPAALQGGSDLRRCLSRPFVPVGDGSLQFLQTTGPWEAAEQVAAWLATMGDDLAETVIIGGDAILDEALHRFGLPTLGAPGSSADNSLLEILPLLIACGWETPAPGTALELLTLPMTPVPPFIAGSLARCLSEWPAVGSDTWNETLADRLARVSDPDVRQRISERMKVIFDLTFANRFFRFGKMAFGADLPR